MKIQEPEKAIQAYEDALKLNPEDPILASRIGKVGGGVSLYVCVCVDVM